MTWLDLTWLRVLSQLHIYYQICWWYCGSGPHFQQYETAYLVEVERLTSWCQDNCFSLNVSKTKELIVDFRKRHLRPYTPLMISGTPVERVSSFKYLGVNISEDLTWTTHIQTQVKKARQRITWPFDFDACVVFRSADFVKYFVILSVNFKPLCIGLIMSASTVKGDRKREIGQSPIKKRFRDSTISREDIDVAIANGIKLAFKEQQSTLDSVVTSAVRDAVDSVLIPALRKLREDIQATNNSVKELREEFEAMAAAAKQTRDRVDSVQVNCTWG